MTWHTAFSSSFLPKFLKGKFDKHILSNGTLSVCSFFTKVFLRGSILNWHFIVTFQDGISPLMVATANNRLNCVKLLLSEGALPYLKSNVSSSKSLCSSIMKIALSWSNYPSLSTFEQLFLILLLLPLSCDSNDRNRKLPIWNSSGYRLISSRQSLILFSFWFWKSFDLCENIRVTLPFLLLET